MSDRAGKAIVILIDGLGADCFSQMRSQLPHLDALAREGLHVERLRSPVCATSLPGRTSMLTGACASAHGVYGNRVFDADRFRYASPDDVRLPSLAQVAKDAGLDVASVGYAMTRPEDCTTFAPPWWVSDWLQRGRDPVPEAVDASWRNAFDVVDPGDRLAQAWSAGFPRIPETVAADDWSAGMLADHATISTVAALANAGTPPDLILTEINMTDEIQHTSGFMSEAACHAIATADALVGNLVAHLRASGRLDDYALAIASDHGHSPIETAIYPDAIAPEAIWASEGSMLHVATRSNGALNRLTAALEELGAHEFPREYLPADHRQHVATFVAPDAHAFESRRDDASDHCGPPRAISSHGLRPGDPRDDRLLVFAGNGVSDGRYAVAEPSQFAASVAHLLGLADEAFDVEPIFTST